MSHHDQDAPVHGGRSPANRLGLDYHTVPPRRFTGRSIDIHTHVRRSPTLPQFFEAADLYGVGTVVSMTPLDEVPALQDEYGDRLRFIAIPNWRQKDRTEDFRRQWLADLEAFAGRGARRMKFWMAPPMREKFPRLLRDDFFTPVLEQGCALGFDFMIHAGDPTAWFAPGGKYADAARFGTKESQYDQLEYLLERVAPRNVIAAHMGGNCEDPGFLARLLDRYPNLYLDSSATKWIVRAVAAQPEGVRALLLRHPTRILFGSDLVVADHYDFDHYASRYWCQVQMWESVYRGESPIEDPDAAPPPRLAGVDLPAEVLMQLYRGNAERLGYS
ncbi:MAG: amidohydrolase family protein [Phycisphaerales bacterium]|nr:amidohydrolase family protein [Phycisphaerales bacterium]